MLQQITHWARETGAPQLFAWDRSMTALRSQLSQCVPEAQDCGLILEFELPRSGGRRPDLLVLNNGVVLVIEFKNRLDPEPADLDQVLGYLQHLSDYHSFCRDRRLIPILIPLGWTGEPREERGVRIIGPAYLSPLIRELASHRPPQPPDPEAFISAPYEPLPALIDSAKLLFERQPLPRIKTADSAHLPQTVQRLEEEINDALARRANKLLLVTGVPGSGKTFLGLQIAHSRAIPERALYLSGNGPLVQVLQKTLNSTSIVLGMKSFLKDAYGRRPKEVRERVFVFDEAQRAWDRDRVLEKHQGDLTASEPELLMQIASRGGTGSCVLALLGEGQEIHAGEESGMTEWISAAKTLGNWEIIGPRHLHPGFVAAQLPYREESLFNLVSTLRSHRASDLSLWAGLLLQDKIERARELGVGLRHAGYRMKISRSLETLREYVISAYQDQPRPRIGLLASSKFRKLEDYGIEATPQRFYYYDQWYEAPPSHPRSGARLQLAVSEFGCQGLELDMPLLCWGPDLRWENGRWTPKVGKPRKVRDPHRLRINAYRVLLTRGREGLSIFVPPLPELDATFAELRAQGFDVI